MTSEEFLTQLKQLSKRIESTRANIQTEEATKMSFIVPFFQILGYDVFNPSEFIPEFTADVGIKKGEKVDYAIFINGEPTILIEAKWCGERLENHDGQLFRYFSTSNARFAILTNGIIYKFYTDLDQKNKMDDKPFLEINMLELKDSQIHEIKKFCKEKFDVNAIFSSASELKYTNNIKQTIMEEFASPSEQFVKLLITNVYEGVKTQKVVDDFKIIVKKSFSQYINELINDRLKSALDTERAAVQEASPTVETSFNTNEGSENKVITTEDELQAFYIIKSMLVQVTSLENITYKDTESYFGILYQNNSRKWICRIRFGGKSKSLMLPTEGNKAISIPIEGLEDLYLHKDAIIKSASKFVVSE